MALRMLCTECLHVAEPDTVLHGSDRAELIGWCCFAVPGLVYCWWRHLCRYKVCPQCGSDALMRECRAAAARRLPQAPPAGGPCVRSLSGVGFAWPRSLGSTRVRLRHGVIGALLTVSGSLAWLLGALDVAPPSQAQAAAIAGWLLFATWLVRQLQQIARLRSGAMACRAWDEHGRPLPIERV